MPPKQKVRQSAEKATDDKAVEPAPLCDDSVSMPADFMSFVRLALNAMNKKLDNIMTQQSKMENKLSDIEATVTGHATAIQTITETVRELEKSMEYTSNNQQHLTQNKLPELSSHLEQLASALVLRTLDGGSLAQMELDYSRSKGTSERKTSLLRVKQQLISQNRIFEL